jgi:hypothetical protein
VADAGPWSSSATAWSATSSSGSSSPSTSRSASWCSVRSRDRPTTGSTSAPTSRAGTSPHSELPDPEIYDDPSRRAPGRHGGHGDRPRRTDGRDQPWRCPVSGLRRAGARHRVLPLRPADRGAEGPGATVYRTVEDLDAIIDAALGASHGVVIGGGLLGLEAADALRSLELTATVVEFAPRLMPAQLDAPASGALRSRIEELGIGVRTDTQTSRVVRGEDGHVSGLEFADGTSLSTDLVVFSAGIRPRDELAAVRAPRGRAGRGPGRRGLPDRGPPRVGGRRVRCGRGSGLRARRSRVRHGADRRRPDRRRSGASSTGATCPPSSSCWVSTWRASVTPGHLGGGPQRRLGRPGGAVHRKLVVSDDGRLLGGILVGDADAYPTLHQLVARRRTPPRPGGPAAGTRGAMPRRRSGRRRCPTAARCAPATTSRRARCVGRSPSRASRRWPT